MSLARTAALAAATASLCLTACGQTTGPTDADASIDASADDVQPDVQPSDVQPDIAVDAGPSGIGMTCTAPPGPGGAPQQGECADGQICLPDEYGFMGGYCSQQCSGTHRCPSDSACVNVGGAFQLCLARCTSNSDCRTMDGYVCATSMGGARVCQPSDGPIGTRDGGACYTTTAGANQIPALANHVFGVANLSASEGRSDTRSAAEGNVVINPMNGAATDSYIALGVGQDFMGSSVTPDGTSVVRTGSARDPMQPLTSDPVLQYTRDGHLHMVYLGYNSTASGNPTMMRVRMADSTDDGRTWTNVRAIEPAGFCGALCDKPWIAAGPSVGDAGTESLYVAFLQQTMSNANLVVVRSDDEGATWTTPTPFAGIESVGSSMVEPNLNTMVVGADGTVHVVYLGLSGGVSDPRFGSTLNRVVYRRSSDGGRTWTNPIRVGRLTDSPVYNQPWLGLDGSTIHVAFASGTPDGAWDIVLASSSDAGVTWTYRKVNDEPDSCATHAFPVLATDSTRHVVHVMWLDNRFGDGNVGYAQCPSDPSMPCGANERINDATFTFATSRDPTRWHGDYPGLAVGAMGDLWATWSDTRTGTPQMYMAHGH